MKRSFLVVATFIFAVFVPAGCAREKCCLAGQIVDHTHNNGRDQRIWSAALCERRDMYVYLPPGYDPTQKYPLMIWLHGLGLDEQDPVKEWVQPVDRAIVCGKLPPMIIAIPDGSRRGRAHIMSPSTFFINSKMGRFEDYLEQDVWDFLVQNYPIRPERQAHVLAGFSGGGTAAYYHGIKYKDRYGAALAISGPLNLRWLDCHGRYFSDFDPNCWGWRDSVRPGHEVIGRFYGVFTFRLGQLIYPLFGRGPEAVAQLSEHNPIEMLERWGVKEGEISMFVAYSGRDQFNLKAQSESFLYRAQELGLTVGTAYDPRGRHDWATAERMMPAIFDWLGPRLAPFSPPMICRP